MLCGIGFTCRICYSAEEKTLYSCNFIPLAIYLANVQITQLPWDSCACSLLLRKQLAVLAAEHAQGQEKLRALMSSADVFATLAAMAQ